MSSRYDFTSSDDEESYQFTTESGDKFTVWFTDFFLRNEEGKDIQIYSFGFDRLRNSLDSPNKFDAKVKATILNIITEFFRKNPHNAVLYICMPADGKARNRHITFSRWFNELGNNFTKCDSPIRYAEHDFYSSLIVLNNNPQKNVFIDAFFFSVEYWMGE